MNEKKIFTVLRFATIYDLEIPSNGFEYVSLEMPQIVEIAAVKVSNGEILGHYHTFVAIDGYDVSNLEFGDIASNFYRLRPEHLIGAPNMKTVIESLAQYIGDSVIVVARTGADTLDDFNIFKEKAKELGFPVQNEVIGLFDGFDEDRDIRDVLLDYGICFDPECDDPTYGDRHDPLTWALMDAKFLIALIDDGKLGNSFPF